MKKTVLILLIFAGCQTSNIQDARIIDVYSVSQPYGYRTIIEYDKSKIRKSLIGKLGEINEKIKVVYP